MPRARGGAWKGPSILQRQECSSGRLLELDDRKMSAAFVIGNGKCEPNARTCSTADLTPFGQFVGSANRLKTESMPMKPSG